VGGGSSVGAKVGATSVDVGISIGVGVAVSGGGVSGSASWAAERNENASKNKPMHRTNMYVRYFAMTTPILTEDYIHTLAHETV